MKVCREFDDVPSAGKLFRVRAAATGNARSAIVDSRVTVRPMPTSTMTAGVIDRLKGVGQLRRSKSTDALVYHDGTLEGYALRHTKPVQAAE